MKTVVVTGVGRYLGAHVASRLASDPGIDHVIGVDEGEPNPDLDPRVDVVRVDIGTTEISSVIAESGAEVVVHLSVATSPHGYPGGRAAMKEHNVIGTMQLLAACQQASGLRKLVVRSSTAAYGASFRDPAVFTEETEPREVPRGGFARDILDIEGYVRGFRRRRPDVAATVLRFVPFVGRQADTALTRYFAQPAVPTVLGRDPRLQFLHLDDALEVLHRSVTEEHPGTFNVAGTGVLMLSQAIRRAGRIGVPVLEFGLSGAATFVPGISLDQLDLFVHGRVVDTTRLIKEYGFTPRSTAEAFDEFVRARQPGAVLGRDRIAAAERRILDGIRRVRHARG
jgi:UDP-glucose 4-epimerase